MFSFLVKLPTWKYWVTSIMIFTPIWGVILTICLAVWKNHGDIDFSILDLATIRYKSHEIATQEEIFNSALLKKQKILIAEQTKFKNLLERSIEQSYNLGAVASTAPKPPINSTQELQSSINESLKTVSNLQFISKNEFDELQKKLDSLKDLIARAK
jgi:hypothetical protein